MRHDDKIVRGGRLYEIVPYRNPWGEKSVLRFTVYVVGGDRLGCYRYRREAMEDIERHATRDLSAQQLASIRAEEEATAAGLKLLDRFRLMGYANYKAI